MFLFLDISKFWSFSLVDSGGEGIAPFNMEGGILVALNCPESLVPRTSVMYKMYQYHYSISKYLLVQKKVDPGFVKNVMMFVILSFLDELALIGFFEDTSKSPQLKYEENTRERLFDLRFLRSLLPFFVDSKKPYRILAVCRTSNVVGFIAISDG